nr:hypothetical protein CFP56_55011 [Quercus suber]
MPAESCLRESSSHCCHAQPWRRCGACSLVDLQELNCKKRDRPGVRLHPAVAQCNGRLAQRLCDLFGPPVDGERSGGGDGLPKPWSILTMSRSAAHGRGHVTSGRRWSSVGRS